MTDIIGKLSLKEAETKIKEIAKLGSVTISVHCQDKMRERDIDVLDLHNILESCKITDPPQYDQVQRQWKYKAKGYVIDGDSAVAITIIASHRELFVVTVW